MGSNLAWYKFLYTRCSGFESIGCTFFKIQLIFQVKMPYDMWIDTSYDFDLKF